MKSYMESFINRLLAKIRLKQSHVVVGLDPVHEFLPETIIKNRKDTLERIGSAIIDFNQAIIDAIYDLVPAIKPQIAYYERYGIEGIKAFVETVKYAKKKGLIIIEDAKRNDIGSTANAYSDGHIGKVSIKGEDVPVFDVDAITVTPFLGLDGILPFIKDSEKYSKGIFILVKTSNPSAPDLQDLTIQTASGQVKLYEILAQFVNKWGSNLIDDSGYSAVGAVVGATYPNDAKILRKLMPHNYFLVPGFGAQGGGVNDIINSFNEDGYGALISASRSINYAFNDSTKYGDSDFDKAARETVKNMNNEINNALSIKGILNW